MKKTASVICMVLCLLLIAGQSAFAAGLEITDIVPKNGESGRQVQNMAVKLTFSENMMDEAAIEKNTSLFKITDPEGTEVPFKLAYSEEKYPDQLWLIIEGALNANTEYTVTVQPGVRSAAGSSLGSAYTSTFKTRNTTVDGWLSMLMMFGMLAVMIFSTRQAAKKAAETANSKPVAAVYEEMNPYKLAKEKNISVEEAKKIIDGRREKQARDAAKREAAKRSEDEAMAAEIAAQEKRIEEELETARKANNIRVHRSGSVVERGLPCPKSVVKANRKKREAEAKAKKAAAKKAKK